MRNFTVDDHGDVTIHTAETEEDAIEWAEDYLEDKPAGYDVVVTRWYEPEPGADPADWLPAEEQELIAS